MFTYLRSFLKKLRERWWFWIKCNSKQRY